MKAFRLFLGSALPLIGACNAHPLTKPTPDPQRTTQNDFQTSSNNDLDVLFMVDNSTSMSGLQQKLVAQFPPFMDPGRGAPGMSLAWSVTRPGQVGARAHRVAGAHDRAGAGVVVVLAGAIGVGPATA